jgi:hypothetical protein
MLASTKKNRRPRTDGSQISAAATVRRQIMQQMLGLKMTPGATCLGGSNRCAKIFALIRDGTPVPAVQDSSCSAGPRA